ncbi:MAG: Flp pilus assembly complex ATPase component TadA [Candidatus Peribacteria bacterium]|nr:MAG: Flp pilus assembly complex ATPase component TadA [Candidatus Peribacteria bacterium]
MYAALDVINEPEVNIVTYEDPVENKMIGLSQSQVRSDIGFTFASGLRAALRQDPDIIMV